MMLGYQQLGVKLMLKRLSVTSYVKRSVHLLIFSRVYIDVADD